MPPTLPAGLWPVAWAWPQMEQLQPFHEPTMNAAAGAATLVCTGIYLALGLASAAVFGREVKGDVLLNFTQVRSEL